MFAGATLAEEIVWLSCSPQGPISPSPFPRGMVIGRPLASFIAPDNVPAKQVSFRGPAGRVGLAGPVEHCPGPACLCLASPVLASFPSPDHDSGGQIADPSCFYLPCLLLGLT